MNWNELLNFNRMAPEDNINTDYYSSQFELDYHRIIGSVSFRRLQDKTQVFPLDKSDFIRTRLTHSIEVSSFGRTLGEMISNRIIDSNIDSEFQISFKDDIKNILECAGLIHDIGNPPFGHFGEVAIRTWFRDHLDTIRFKNKPLNKILSKRMISDFVNFDGNAQGLRLATKLNFGLSNCELNLTYGLLGTIIKYPNTSLNFKPSSEDNSKHKLGYFSSEDEVFNRIEKKCGLKNCRHPLTYVLESADDIAYSTADIEDGFKKGFIKFDELINEIRALENKYEELGKGEAYITSEILSDSLKEAKTKKIFNAEEYAICKWIKAVQNYFLNAACDGFINNYSAIMEGSFKSNLLFNTYADVLMERLKKLGWIYIFDTPFIYKPEVRSWHVYEFLLKKFVRAVLYYDTDLSYQNISPIDKKVFSMIDPMYVRNYILESNGAKENVKLYLRLRLAVDFICSMTDSKALDMYQQLSGIVD